MRKAGVLRFKEHNARYLLASNLWRSLEKVFPVVIEGAWDISGLEKTCRLLGIPRRSFRHIYRL